MRLEAELRLVSYDGRMLELLVFIDFAPAELKK